MTDRDADLELQLQTFLAAAKEMREGDLRAVKRARAWAWVWFLMWAVCTTSRVWAAWVTR